jgi:hypothetical protein
MGENLMADMQVTDGVTVPRQKKPRPAGKGQG